MSQQNTVNVMDLVGFDSLLNEDEIALRSTVREFVDATIRPNIAEWYEKAVFPLEIVPEMAKLGLLGMHRKGYGCAGRSAGEYGLAGAELEAGIPVCARSCPCRAPWP